MNNADFLEMCRYAVSDDKDEQRPGKKAVCQSELEKNSLQVVTALLAMYDAATRRAEAAEAKLESVQDYAEYFAEEINDSGWALPFADWLVTHQRKSEVQRPPQNVTWEMVEKMMGDMRIWEISRQESTVASGQPVWIVRIDEGTAIRGATLSGAVDIVRLAQSEAQP